MKTRFIETIRLVKSNAKTLILFEVFYRMLGILIFFPMINSLFLYSIRASGYSYITNSLIFEYLTAPTTLFIAFLMLVILGVYVAFEMVVLSILFHYSRQEATIPFKDLINISIRKLPSKIKQHHIFFILFAWVFFIVVNIVQFSGIASTLSIPPFIMDNLFSETIFIISAFVFGIVLFILFIENIFSMNVITIEDKSFKASYKRMRRLLKGNRLKLIRDFAVLNFLLNVTLYGIYILIVGFIALFIFLTSGQAVVLGALLTLIYTIYLIIALIASMIVLPLNYAWMSEWYHYRTPDSEKIPIKTFNKGSFDLFKLKYMKPIVALVIIVALIFNGTTVYATVQRRGGIDLFNQPDIIAHRGSSLRAPENTIASIELAIEENADAIEFDVLLTSDSVPVLMHDTTTGRTTNDSTSRRVDSISFEELRELDAGSWFSSEFEGEQIPTLEEALLAIDGRADVHIDLKNYTPEMVDIVVETVETLDLVDDVVIYTFDSDQLRQIKALNEDIQTLFLVYSFFGSINNIIQLDYVDSYGFNRFVALQNPSYADAIRSSGKDFYVWTVNDQETLRELRYIGVDGIITDDPILAREIAYGTYSNPTFSNLLRELFSP